MEGHASEAEDLVPPPGLIVEGHREIFVRSGQELFEFIRGQVELRPAETVLDIGCGAGRLAVPLTRYLTEDGAYEGFDVSPERIEWLTQAIGSRLENFRFQLVDIYNRTYNWKGKTPGTEFSFPYPDEHFDFALSISVFTHMLADDVAHYLSEIARVLKPGARWLGTYFLLNNESLELLRKTEGDRQDPAWNAVDAKFNHDFGSYRVGHEQYPEAVVAYDEAFVLDLYHKHGFEIREPIHYGRWPGRESSVPGGQDLVFANRK